MPSLGPGTGASLWTPRNGLPALVDWWDFSDDNTFTGVTEIRDKSGNGYRTTTVWGTPTRTDLINGLPVVTFPVGSINYFNTNAPAVDATSSAFGLVRFTNVDNYRTPFGATAINAIDYMIMTTSGVWHVSKDAVADIAVYSGTVATGTVYVISVVMDAATVNFGLNGAYENQSTAATPSGAGNLRFGSAAGVSNGGFDIGEFFRSSERVSEDVRNRAVQYLAAKWGVRLNAGSAYSPPLVFT